MIEPLPDLRAVTDALEQARGRGLLPTNLDTAGLRELDAGLRARAVFTARGTNAVFTAKIKEVVDAIAGDTMSPQEARRALAELLRALGYTPEGGFPDAEPGAVPPAIEGSLQDLSSFRRLDLIVRTQTDLMTGAGQQARGHARAAAFPAWELVRVMPVEVPRDWPSRWRVAGGAFYDGGRIIALKGDPVWGELGASANFEDALDVDHPPFAFNSGMGWREVSAGEVRDLGVRGPNGESPREWLASGPITLRGAIRLPEPQISMPDEATARQAAEATGGDVTVSASGRYRAKYNARLQAALERRRAEYEARNPDRPGTPVAAP